MRRVINFVKSLFNNDKSRRVLKINGEYREVKFIGRNTIEVDGIEIRDVSIEPNISELESYVLVYENYDALGFRMNYLIESDKRRKSEWNKLEIINL